MTTRFFFDVVGNAKCTHDFHGRYLKSTEEARDIAEAVSFDLACTERDECVGSEIQVRDSNGVLLFSITVRAAEAVFG